MWTILKYNIYIIQWLHSSGWITVILVINNPLWSSLSILIVSFFLWGPVWRYSKCSIGFWIIYYHVHQPAPPHYTGTTRAKFFYSFIYFFFLSLAIYLIKKRVPVKNNFLSRHILFKYVYSAVRYLPKYLIKVVCTNKIQT